MCSAFAAAFSGWWLPLFFHSRVSPSASRVTKTGHYTQNPFRAFECNGDFATIRTADMTYPTPLRLTSAAGKQGGTELPHGRVDSNP